MDVHEAIDKRRSYRALEPIQITPKMLNSLAKAAQLMCSCYNNQPWRFVFVYNAPYINDLKEKALTPGNRWAQASSMIIAVFSKPDLDCIIKDRSYYLFDTGLAVGSMLLQATELGLVLHPIAGYDPDVVHEILKIPKEYEIITLLILGKKSEHIPDFFQDFQVKAEKVRPERKNISELVFQNYYSS